MQAIRLTLPTEEAAQQSPATKKAKAGTSATAFPAILSGVQRAPGTAAEGGGRAAQRLVLGSEGTAGLEGKTANGDERGLAALFGGALLRARDGEGKAQKRILLASEGGTASGTGPSASVETVKLMPILRAAGGKNAAGGENAQGGENVGSLVVRAVRAGKQTAGQAGAEGENAPSSRQKAEGGSQVRVSWGLVASTSGDGTARSVQKGQKTISLVKGAGGTEGGARQTASQGASGGRGAGANASTSSESGSGRTKQVQVSPGTVAAESGEGRSSQGTDGQASRGKAASKRMPEGGRAGTSAKKGGRFPGSEGALLGGEKGRPGQNTGRPAGAKGSNAERQVRGDAGRSQGAGSGTGGSAQKDGTRGKQIAPSSLKGGGSEPGRGREGTSEGRSARTARDGAQSTGRRGRGRSGQRGGMGQQGGGQQGQGPGQNGQGQKTVPVVKGAGGTEGGAQQTVRQGASGGRGAGANGASSSGTGSGRAKRVQVSPGTVAVESGEGRSGQGSDGQLSKGKGPVRRMPEGERAGASARKGGRGPGQEGTLLSGEKRRPGQNAGRSSRPNGVRSEGQVRGDAGRPQDAGSRAGGSAKKDGTRGKQIAPSALKGGGAESGRGREGTSEGRSARTARDGARSTGRRGRGRSGQRGGTGQQGGGQQGQGPGQNGQGQKGQTQGAKNGPGFQALASSSTSTSGESDARTLRASLTQDGASTGGGTQTDGKGANASGGGSGAASKAKADARSTGKSGPPRTMPSAWLNAARNGPLRTAELAGGWKALEMSLGEDKGTMTVKARQGQEQTAVSVGFSETRVQAQVASNARQLQDAMQAQYGTDVDLSFSGGDANESDQQASDGASSEGASALAPGDESTDADESSGASLRGRGRREWIG
ncbi:hypothetical protein [Salinibacter ruber]|uniref:hypothetical protein n=1 Tax=Salinibacter ruber TaxID=146919 RepID=UPI002073F27A|nr:hypothetical protein [Salinibacter ruber]